MRMSQSSDRQDFKKFRKNFQKTFDGLVGAMRNDNMLNAIEALSRYEEKYALAVAADNTAITEIYKDKIKMIQCRSH